MSAKNAENTEEKENLLAKQNDVALAQCTTAVETTKAAALDVVAERTTTSGASATRSAATLAPVVRTLATTTSVVINDSSIAGGEGGGSTSSSSSVVGCGGAADVSSEKRAGSDDGDKSNSNKQRKTRRGKTKRGKRSSSTRPYSKSQWKWQVPHLRTAANKRRAKLSLSKSSHLAIVPSKDPFIVSDQPPLVPYNTNRFLMEDHMPHVLTPSEDEEEFLTKEFSSVYEDARSERLEGLSKGQLIQEYLQLEANYEQVTRRYNVVKSSIKEENESAVNNATPTTMTTKDAPEAGARRLEDRIRELTAENLELRRQLEHASRIGMVLSAKSSPRNYGNVVERMDSSSCNGTSSEDSESDSSSSGSSSSSDDDDDDDCSSSSMSGDDDYVVVQDRQPPQPLALMEESIGDLPIPMDAANDYNNQHHHHHQNGGDDDGDEGVESHEEDELNGAVSPLSAHSINSPPPLVMN